MNENLKQMQEAAEGLFYMSESDYPFEVIELKQTDTIEEQLLKLSNKPTGSNIEKVSLDYFLRNMTRIDPTADDQQHDNAKKFTKLKTILKEKLENIEVWRIGTIQIDAFIIGNLQDGSLGGLRTKSVET